MFKDELQLKINALKKERDSIFEQIKPLNIKVQSLYDDIEELNGKLSEVERNEMDQSGITEDARIAYYLENDGDTKGSEHYHATCKFWQDMGMRPDGYFPSINQKSLSVMLYKDKSTNAKTIDTITKTLPHMKTIDGIDEYRPNIKVFGIFEHTLSEYGSYSLFFDTDTEEWIVSIIVYRSRRDVYVTKSLDDVINYISEHHSYDFIEED